LHGWTREVLEGLTAVLKLDALDVEIPFEKIYRRVF
jgi:hypothetical protein